MKKILGLVLIVASFYYIGSNSANSNATTAPAPVSIVPTVTNTPVPVSPTPSASTPAVTPVPSENNKPAANLVPAVNTPTVIPSTVAVPVTSSLGITVAGSGQVITTSQGTEHIVKVISDYTNMVMAFDPKTLFVNKGDTVTWVNQANESHNMITYYDGYPEGAVRFVSPFLDKQGDKWSFKFDHEGTFQYHCIPHVMMGMRGEIIVGKSSKPTEFHKPTPAEVKEYRDRMLEFFSDDDVKHMPGYVQEKLKK